MLASFIRRALPLLVLGGLTLGSCTVHSHDYGRRDDRHDRHDRNRWHDHDRHHRDYGYRH